MRNFACPNCGRIVFFESFACQNCGTPVGFSPESRAMVPVPDASLRCAHRVIAGCNWVVRPSEVGRTLTDYPDALQRHYRDGPPPGWEDSYISAYATAHPWEDWAETFAHYLTIRDTLQTAAFFGLVVAGPSVGTSGPTTPSPRPQARIEDIVADWIPLAGALNAINRSLGHHDAYPFTLSLTVMAKLAFVHDATIELLAATR